MSLFATIISGVIVFVLSQFLLKLIIEPIQEFRKELAITLQDLYFYENRITNPRYNIGNIEKELSNKLRQHFSALASKGEIIPFYNFFVYLNFLPKRQNINKIIETLVFLSNSVSNHPVNSGEFNSKKIHEIEKLFIIKSNNYFMTFIILTIFSIFTAIIFSISYMLCQTNNQEKYNKEIKIEIKGQLKCQHT